MNILITGAFGQLGSTLLTNIDKIPGLKKVYIVDNLKSNNFNTVFSIKPKKVRIKLIKGSLFDKSIFNRLKSKIDIVIHFASITNAEASFELKNVLFKNNIEIFKNIINFCKKRKSKLIHLSSTSVYNSQNDVNDKNINNLSPQSPYAKVKIYEENLLKKNSKKLKFITLRLATISGVSKSMKFHTSVNKFCLNAILKEPIPIWGKALNLYRPYLSLNDAIKSIIFFIKKNKFNNSVYDLVTENYTVNEILDLIRKHNLKIKIKVVKSPIKIQNSFKVSKIKLESIGLKLSNSIEKDIKTTLKMLKKIS